MSPIGKEDYVEPRCLLCEEPYGAQIEVKPVPQQRISWKSGQAEAALPSCGSMRVLTLPLWSLTASSRPRPRARM